MNTEQEKNLQEKQLVSRLIANEQAAFVEAIQRYQPAMLKFASAIVGPTFADEVVQEAWISITRGLPKFKGQSSLRTWILCIV